MFDFSTNAKQKEAWLFLEIVWEGPEYLCEQVERVERERAKPNKNFAYWKRKRGQRRVALI